MDDAGRGSGKLPPPERRLAWRRRAWRLRARLGCCVNTNLPVVKATWTVRANLRARRRSPRGHRRRARMRSDRSIASTGTSQRRRSASGICGFCRRRRSGTTRRRAERPAVYPWSSPGDLLTVIDDTYASVECLGDGVAVRSSCRTRSGAMKPKGNGGTGKRIWRATFGSGALTGIRAHTTKSYARTALYLTASSTGCSAVARSAASRRACSPVPLDLAVDRGYDDRRLQQTPVTEGGMVIAFIWDVLYIPDPDAWIISGS